MPCYAVKCAGVVLVSYRLVLIRAACAVLCKGICAGRLCKGSGVIVSIVILVLCICMYVRKRGVDRAYRAGVCERTCPRRILLPI